MLWAAIVQNWPSVLAVLVAWLAPSPVTIATRALARVRAAESKATDSRGDVGDLDELP